MPAYDLILKPVLGQGIWNNIKPAKLVGSGQIYDPYLISSAEQLATIAYYVNNSHVFSTPWDEFTPRFLMTNDIDLQNIKWVPIGHASVQGTAMADTPIIFDRGGHKVKNLKITSTEYNSKPQSLFGSLTAWRIKNLSVEGVIDVDLKGYTWTGMGVDEGAVSKYGGQTSLGSSFYGSFDGNGYSIKNMSARSRTQYVKSDDPEYTYLFYQTNAALFGVVDNVNSNIRTQIKNLNLQNVNSVCTNENAFALK